MFSKIKLIEYQVDEAMLGSEWDSEKYNLVDFCEVLQQIVEEQCLFFEIVPITDSYNGANHCYDDGKYALWRNEHLGGFPNYEYAWEWLDWDLAVERYLGKFK